MSLTDIQYDSIMREYSRLRLANKALEEQRLDEVQKAAPAIRTINEELSTLSIQEAKNRLRGHADDPEYEKNLRALTLLRTQALTDAGFPADYLDTIYNCPDCKDTGFFNGKRCTCFRRKLVTLISEQTGIDKVLEEENFEHLTDAYYSAKFIDQASGRSSLDIMTHSVIPACRAFVADFGKKEQNLLFYGDCGTGKTFLSHCIAAELIKQGFSVLYMTSFELFDTLGRERFSYRSERSPVVDSIFDCDLLIIDDLGTEMTNNFVASELFQCINERLLRKRAMLISTNLTPNDLHKRYTERVASRMLNSFKLLKCVGNDIRTIKTLRQD